jgi:hypothetical protein
LLQEALRFNPMVDNRWCVVCKDVMDWRALAELFRTSRSKLEKMLHSILKNEFLPSIEEIYAQKEKEKEKKMAALIAKRTSDRLEVKRLQREEEVGLGLRPLYNFVGFIENNKIVYKTYK